MIDPFEELAILAAVRATLIAEGIDPDAPGAKGPVGVRGPVGPRGPAGVRMTDPRKRQIAPRPSRCVSGRAGLRAGVGQS